MFIRVMPLAYQVEWTTAGNFGANETKLVTVVSNVEGDTDGRFILRFGGQATSPLRHNASVAEVQRALKTLATVVDIDVTSSSAMLESSQSAAFGSSWIVEFFGATGPLPKAGYACASCVSGVSNNPNTTSTAQPIAVNVTLDLREVLIVGDRVSLFPAHTNTAGYNFTCHLQTEDVGEELILASELPGSACSLADDPETSLAISFFDPSGLVVEHVDLRSVSGEGVISTYVTELVSGTYPDVYGYVELSAEETCGASMLGPSSSTQKLILSAGPFHSTPVPLMTGSYRLALGGHMTECIAFNASSSEVTSALEKLPNVAGGVSVFARVFVDNGMYYPVDGKEMTVTNGLGFDYLIRFWGDYPSRDGEWPQLRVPAEYFGKSVGGKFECESFRSADPDAEPSAQVIMVKQARTCAAGNPATQVIMAEASSALGGSVSLCRSNGEQKIIPLTATAAEMEELISDALAIPVDVIEGRMGSYSKAWLVSFDPAVGDTDRLALCDRFATGTSVAVGVYDALVIETTASSISGNAGNFRITLGGEASDLVSFDASDGRLDFVLQAMIGVGKVTTLSPTALGGSGGVDVLNVTLFNNSANIVTPGDLTKTLALGDITVFEDVNDQYFEVSSLSYSTPSDVTTLVLNHTVVDLLFGQIQTSAVIGKGAISRRPLPGRARMASDVKVLYSYPNLEASVRVLELSDGGVEALGLVLNSTILVSGEAYQIEDYDDDKVKLSSDFTGPTVVAGDIELKVFGPSMMVSFSRDISEEISVGDTIWIENVDGDTDELIIEESFAPNNSYRLSGLFSSEYAGMTAYTVGNGRTWILAFKHTDVNLDTLQVEPNGDWRGLGGKVRVQRPGGIAPLTATLGSPSEVQTIALRSSQPWWPSVNIANNATWSLVMWPGDGATTELPWGASAIEVEEGLETLSAVSSVDVERSGDGESAEWFYGYVYTVSFWGVHSSSSLPQLTVELSLGGVTAYINTVRQAAAIASQFSTLVALKEGKTYSVRASALGVEGYSPASAIAVAETPSIGMIPGHPTAVMLGSCRYSSTSLGVKWQPPLRDGGQPVDAYRIEWDRSQPISETSAAYGTEYLQVTHEVQEIVVNFRSGDSISIRGGTFSVSWGGHSTADLPWDSSASMMEAAILAISGVQELAINPISVTRVSYRNGYRWTVIFMAWRGDLALLQGDRTLLVGDDPSLTFREKAKGRADIYPGDYTNEVQAITVTALSEVSGTFTLAFEGKEVEAVAFNESPESFKSKLEAIDNIFCVDIKRFTLNADLNMYSWYVTLAWLNGEVIPGAGNLGLLTVSSTSDLDGNGADVGIFELVAGTNPMKYTISNLIAGVQYYGRVAAHNSRGFGEFSKDTSGIPWGQPTSPMNVSLAIASGSALTVSWSRPVSDGGAVLTGYIIEWYTTADPGTSEVQMITTSAKKGVNEVQVISIMAAKDNLGGYFKLSFDGQTTGNIAWDAPATGTDSVREKLERLPGIGDADVTQDYSRVAVTGLRVDVAVGADHATTGNASSLLPSQSGLVKNDIVVLAGYRARVRGFSSDGEALLFGSLDDYTEPDTFAEEFGAEGVIVEKWAYGYEYTVRLSSYNGNAPLMEGFASDGWAGTNPIIKIDEVTAGLQPISGTFRVRLGRENTPPLAHDSTAEEIETALEGMIDISDVTVSKVLNGYGNNWVVTFTSEMGNVDLMEADGTGLTGPSATVSVSVGQDGIFPSFYGSQEIPDASILQHTIDGLMLGEAYSVRARASNREGYGSIAAAAPASLRPLEEPGVPDDVTLIVMSDSMLKVVWSSPSSTGGNAVSQYRIDWDTASDFTNIATSGFFHTLSVGDEDGPYFYNIIVPSSSSWLPRYARVRAYNSFAWGEHGIPKPTSAQPALRPPGEPQLVMLRVTSGAGLLVSWEEPSTNLIIYGGNGGRTIQEYLVEWDTSAKFDSPSRRAVIGIPSALLYLIGGRDLMTGKESTELEPGVTYYARVSAFNSEGYGAVVPTDPVSDITEDTVPTSPERLGSETDGVKSVAGVFGLPTRDGGETLTKYRLEWDVSDDFSHINGSSFAGGWEDVPLVQEVQAFAVSSTIGQEEQWIVATVEVTNERQTVRTQVSFRVNCVVL